MPNGSGPMCQQIQQQNKRKSRMYIKIYVNINCAISSVKHAIPGPTLIFFSAIFLN